MFTYVLVDSSEFLSETYHKVISDQNTSTPIQGLLDL